MSCMPSKTGKSHPVELQASHLATSLKKNLLLEPTSGHIKEETVTGSSKQGLTKGQSCLTHLTAFYNIVVGMRGEHLPLP